MSFQANGTGKMRVHLYNAGGAGTVYWDDIQIVAGWGSGFESGLAPWATYGSTGLSVTSSLARSGSYSLAQSGASGGAYQDISGLVAGQFYHISAFARSSAGGTVPASLFVHDTLGVNVAADGAGAPSSSTWTGLGLNFAATGTGKVRVHLNYAGGAGLVYWDDVQLVPGWLSDFETVSLGGWAPYGTTSSTLSSTAANSGAYSLRQSGGTGGMYQDISGLLPGELYVVTARALSAPGTTAQAVLWTHDTTGSNATGSAWKTPSSANWESYTTYFVADSTGKLRVHLHFVNASGTIYWDDVRVSKVY